MKVLMLNGSPNKEGSTYTALNVIGEVLKFEGIDYEIFWIGSKPIRDCIGCRKCKGEGCIFSDDRVNEFLQKAYLSDGFIFGTPVYFAHPSAAILSFLDRLFYSSTDNNYKKPAFQFKPAASVACARRAGTTASLDVINKYFTIANMLTIGSSYWNMVHGRNGNDVMKDKEGLQTMRNIAHNMAWILKCIELGKQNNIVHDIEVGEMTDFIR